VMTFEDGVEYDKIKNEKITEVEATTEVIA
jgi:hypothetical protein